VDKRHTENQQRNNCGQTPHRKPTIKSTRSPLKEGIKDKQLWTKRHTENQQRNNCGQTPHRKPTDWCRLNGWFSVWRFSTVVSLLVFCVAFVHSCLSVGFLCGVLSTVVCLLSPLLVQTTVDKRRTENQQRNNCGHTSQKRTDKQMWTNATLKINRQTTVDKRHRNEQTNNCGQTPHRTSQFFLCWFSVRRLSTVVCLLIYCVAFCPQLFVFHPLF
jgi:hypothetical protein